MNEREIFAKALEQPSEAERRAFLDNVCDADMRGRIERLLSEQAQLGSFLEHSPVEAVVAEAGFGSEPHGDLGATVLHGDGSTEDDGDATSLERTMKHDAQEWDDEIPLGYLQPSSKPDSLGRLGHYEVLEVVGRGAFGTVLRAFDEKLQRVVAIKVLAPEMAATSPARKRFLREARTSAAIRHENVVAIHAVEDDPIPYLVMDFIPGLTLQQRLDNHGPLAVLDVLKIGKQIADGLAAAHAQDLIHRDIKPGNILLEGGVSERVKITDFGLARTADDASVTQSGLIAGTPMYMAPEQAQGHKLDQRADLFSFGSVLYQMLSGRPPFRAANTVAVLKRVVDDTPRPIQEIIPEVPTWMCELIRHLHAKNPDERIQTAKEVSDLLGRCLDDLKAGRVPKFMSPSQSTASKEIRPATTSGSRETSRVSKKPLARVAAVLVLLAFIAIRWTPRTTEPITQSSPDSQPTTITTPSVDSQGQPAKAPPPAIAPFDAKQAQAHQAAWAKYLGVPVERELSLGQDKDGKDVTLTMVLIPPGEFMIGATDEEQKKWLSVAKADHPNAKDDLFATIHMEDQRFVRITKPFWLSKLEFTTGQFRRFVESTGYKTDAETNGQGAARPAAGKGFERLPELHWDNWGKISVDAGPVVNVSWNDAAKCCEWLSSQHPDMAFSLPTEAQWEFACRAGTKNSLYDCETGEQLREYAQFGDEVHFIQRGGQLRPNAFGLYDMLGNVIEWCSNWLAGYATSPTDDPTGPAVPGKYEMRAVRGGSFIHKKVWRVRSSKRDFYTPDDCFLDRGFRVAAAIRDGSTAPTLRPEKVDQTHRWPADAPPPAIAPFDAEQAKKHQEAWAKCLGVPREKEIVLGQDKDGKEVTLALVLVPPGEFLMGSNEDQMTRSLDAARSANDELALQRIPHESPQHRVKLTRPFYLARYETTQLQWQAMMDGNPTHFHEDLANPVESVGWDDAMLMVEKLNKGTSQHGLKFALPSEAQWEFACRAGTTTSWSGTDDDVDLAKQGWFLANAEGKTHPVGQRSANPFGLHDMHGNVFEWCADWFAPDYYAQSPVDDPQGPSTGSTRVHRGGCWINSAGDLRSAHRHNIETDYRNYVLGFRLAATISDETIQAVTSPKNENSLRDPVDDESPATDTTLPMDKPLDTSHGPP